MAHIAKDVKFMLKEEDDDVADDPWGNGMLIEKAGDMPITHFQIPEDWKPKKEKAAEPDFKEKILGHGLNSATKLPSTQNQWVQHLFLLMLIVTVL
eukprot:5862664-Ditylum_brightwellii.AAC.1